MSSFADIMRRAKKMFKMKDGGGEWLRCEECDERRLCYPYADEKDEVWMLCEACASLFVKDD